MKKFFALALVLLGVFSLAACNGAEEVDEDQAAVDEAVGSLLLGGLDRVTSDINFPTSGRNNTTITWESSHPEFIANTGAVTRPAEGEDNVVVTLTATVSLNDASATREFEAFVVALEPSNVVASYQELYETANINDLVTVEGIVVAEFNGGYFIYDGEDVLGVYYSGSATKGDEVRVTGLYSRYYTLYQIGDVENEEILSSGNDTTVPVSEITIEAFNNDLDLSDPLNHGRFFEVSGTLVTKGEYNNLFIESTETDDDILIYYFSRADALEELEEFVGLNITVTVVYYTNHSANGIMVLFDGTADDVAIDELTDEQKLETDVNNAGANPAFTFGDNVTLPSEGVNGVSFSAWTSSHPELIANDGSFVAMPEERTVVTFTGTATLGDLTQEVEVTVDALAEMSVNEAIEIPAGKNVMITGVITQFVDGNSGFFMTDGEGYIYVRDTAMYSSISENYAVGDVINMVASRDNYRGLPQLTAIKNIEADDQVIELPGNLGMTTAQDIVEGNVIPGASYLIYGEVEVISGNYTDVNIVDGDYKVRVHHNSDNLALEDYNEQMVLVEVYVFQWDYDPAYVAFFGGDDEISTEELTDVQKAEKAAVEIRLGNLDQTVSDITLPTSGSFESTISWVSSSETVLANDGTVTPTLEDETVTLVATVTVNNAVFTREFEVTVLAAPISVENALEGEVGAEILVEGVVIGVDPHVDGYYIQDSQGFGIFVYSEDEVAVGNQVIVLGDRGVYDRYGNDQSLIENSAILYNDEGSHDTIVVTDKTVDTIISEFPETTAQRFRVENVTIASYDNFDHVFLENADDTLDMQLTFDITLVDGFDAETYPVGTELAYIEFTTQRIHFNNYRVFDVEFAE